MSWGLSPAEALGQLEAQVVRPYMPGGQFQGHTCLCCGAKGEWPVRHTQTCPVAVLGHAVRTGHDLYTRTDAEVRGLINDCVQAPMGVVPDSCASLWAEIRAAEG